MRCQCLTSVGTRCKHTASVRTTDNPSYCWQHQLCDYSNISIPENFPIRYIQGPIDVSYMVDENRQMKIYIFGDMHVTNEGCPSSKYNQTLKFHNYLDWQLKLMPTIPIDVFVEQFYNKEESTSKKFSPIVFR